MKEHPILFCDEMVPAILDGRKTQTRRIAKLDSRMMEGEEADWCPYGGPGDQLWVREAFGYAPASLPSEHLVSYKVDLAHNGWTPARIDWAELTVWRPSIHMPRWASRITLELVSVRAERLQDISEEDAKAEGVNDGMPFLWLPDEWQIKTPNKARFAGLWELLNNKRGFGWGTNPWVWRLEFRRIKP